MLEEIQVPPLVFPGVMDRAFLAAHRARGMTAFVEVDMQVQPLVLYLEGHIIHQPRRNQPQSQTEELLLIHPNPLRLQACAGRIVPLGMMVIVYNMRRLAFLGA